MISFTVSKDQNTAVLTIDGRAVRLRARRGNSHYIYHCAGCELYKRRDNSGISACEAMTRQFGVPLVTFCTPAERADGRSVIWKEGP